MFGIVSVSDFGRFHMYAVVSHYCFNMPFSGDVWCGASFHRQFVTCISLTSIRSDLWPIRFLNFIFHQMIIALQCSVGFCHTTMRISRNYICLLPPDPPSHPTPHPTPLGCGRPPGWALVLDGNFPLSLLHTVMYIFKCVCLDWPPQPTVSTSLFSIPALQISSSVPFF